MHTNAYILRVLFLGGLLAGSLSARADDCSVAFAASIAQMKVPHTVTHVMTGPGQPPTRAQMIFMGEKIYVQMDGNWMSMPFSAQEQLDTLNKAQTHAEETPHSCQKVGSDPINGESVFLLIMHSELKGEATDARVWISDKTGLPLKSEIHLSDGTVMTDDFGYSNVQAPPGAK